MALKLMIEKLRGKSRFIVNKEGSREGYKKKAPGVYKLKGGGVSKMPDFDRFTCEKMYTFNLCGLR